MLYLHNVCNFAAPYAEKQYLIPAWQKSKK